MATDHLNMRIDTDTKEKLKKMAAADNRTISSYIKNLICREYDKWEKGK